MKSLAILPVVFLFALAQHEAIEFQPTLCELCQGGIEKVKQKIFRTQNQLKIFLDNYCDEQFHSGSWENNACKTAFNKAVPWVYRHLLKNPNLLDPKQLCTDIHLCSSTQSQMEIKQKSDNFCAACQDGINAVITELGSQIVTHEMGELFISACSKLDWGKNYVRNCENFVTGHFPNFWRQSLSLIDSKMVCSELKLCPAGHGPGIAENLGCSFCKSALGAVRKQFLNIDSPLHTVLLRFLLIPCDAIHNKNNRNACITMIDKYETKYLRKVGEMINPGNICHEKIHICSNAKIG